MTIAVNLVVQGQRKSSPSFKISHVSMVRWLFSVSFGTWAMKKGTLKMALYRQARVAVYDMFLKPNTTTSRIVLRYCFFLRMHLNIALHFNAWDIDG